MKIRSLVMIYCHGFLCESFLMLKFICTVFRCFEHFVDAYCSERMFSFSEIASYSFLFL